MKAVAVTASVAVRTRNMIEEKIVGGGRRRSVGVGWGGEDACERGKGGVEGMHEGLGFVLSLLAPFEEAMGRGRRGTRALRLRCQSHTPKLSLKRIRDLADWRGR